MKHSKINLSDRKRKKVYNKRTHEISNGFYKYHWKSKFHIPEHKEEESVTKKAKRLIEVKRFLCNASIKNSIFQKRIETQEFFSSDQKGEVPNQVRFQ